MYDEIVLSITDMMHELGIYDKPEFNNRECEREVNFFWGHKVIPPLSGEHFFPTENVWSENMHPVPP